MELFIRTTKEDKVKIQYNNFHGTETLYFKFFYEGPETEGMSPYDQDHFREVGVEYEDFIKSIQLLPIASVSSIPIPFTKDDFSSYASESFIARYDAEEDIVTFSIQDHFSMSFSYTDLVKISLIMRD